jgi:acyl-coenzyme A thioesterase PaaI-like protein
MSGRTEVEQVWAIIHDVVDQIPFNHVLGLKVESLNFDQPSVKLEMRPDLIGILFGFAAWRRHLEHLDHGGWFCVLGVLKTMQGSLCRRWRSDSPDRHDRLRIDYLRPVVRKRFIATLRQHRKRSADRTELHNDERS